MILTLSDELIEQYIKSKVLVNRKGNMLQKVRNTVSILFKQRAMMSPIFTSMQASSQHLSPYFQIQCETSTRADVSAYRYTVFV